MTMIIICIFYVFTIPVFISGVQFQLMTSPLWRNNMQLQYIAIINYFSHFKQETPSFWYPIQSKVSLLVLSDKPYFVILLTPLYSYVDGWFPSRLSWTSTWLLFSVPNNQSISWGSYLRQRSYWIRSESAS